MYSLLLLQVERKRARNRVAASKCRMRKMEKIATLDQEANVLRNHNDELANLNDKLRQQVYKLQQELHWHINNGCTVNNTTKDLIAQVRNKKKSLEC